MSSTHPRGNAPVVCLAQPNGAFRDGLCKRVGLWPDLSSRQLPAPQTYAHSRTHTFSGVANKPPYSGIWPAAQQPCCNGKLPCPRTIGTIRYVPADSVGFRIRTFGRSCRGDEMRCIHCDSEARAVCQFCGRAVCETHIKEQRFVSGFTPYGGFWRKIKYGVRVEKAVWCGHCQLIYQQATGT